MKISRAVGYAISAILQMEESGGGAPVPCNRLATGGNMPERFLLQVLRQLVNHGLMKSTRGTDGGYSLIRPASQITLLDVIEGIDGPVRAELPDIEALPPAVRKNLQAYVDKCAADTTAQFSAVTIASLATTGGLPGITPPTGGAHSAENIPGQLGK